MIISLTLEFHKCTRGTDIEINGELEEEEETALIANTENGNLDCSDKGKNTISTFPPSNVSGLIFMKNILMITV